MAAGRHRVYRDNDFGSHESDVKFLRKEVAYVKRQANNDYEDIRVTDRKDRLRVRKRDVMERETVNGEHRSSSRSDSGSSGGVARGPRRCELAIRSVDREPGELSSESGSDDTAIEIESTVDKDNAVRKVRENGIQVPTEKKRKFSPIIWDRDDNGMSNSSKRRASPAPSALPPPSPLPSQFRKSPNVISDGIIEISTIRRNEGVSLQGSSSVKGSLSKDRVDNSVSESAVDVASSPPEEQRRVTDQEFERVEEEDYVTTRNISSSRWAVGNISPDEGEIIEEEEMPMRRKKNHLGSLDSKVRDTSSTLEPSCLEREGSDRARGRSSESDEHIALSGEDYRGNHSEKYDYMETDEKHQNCSDGDDPSDMDSENETASCGTPEPVGAPQRCINMLQGCRSVDEFERLNKIDEGTYGVVYRARDKKTGEIVALKKVKMEKEREGFPLTALREINILLSFHHPSIVDVKEVVVGTNLDSIFMVMEYMEHDLKALMESMKQPFSQSEVKCLMLQLLEGIKYLHDNWVLHRDLKTSNLLLNNRGELKICDFGLARQYGSPLKPYTQLVVTLWYRAPELLLGSKQYSTAIDMWSLGCIMAELLSKQPLFNGKTEADQLDKIFKTLGTPNETIWPSFSKLPGVKVNFVKHQYNQLRKKFPATSFTGSPVLSDAGFDLLNKLLTYDPEKRISVEAALIHDWFREVPLPKSKDFMPTFPAHHVQDRRLRRVMKSPDPLEALRRKELQQAELGTGGLFG